MKYSYDKIAEAKAIADKKIDDCFFDVHYNIYKLRFVNEQKRKIIQNITIEL